jgi:nucleotide-binding universal stress UspA family protein
MEKILIAVDGSDASNCALRRGLELAEGEGADVTIAYVAPATDILPVSLFGATAAVAHDLTDYDREVLADAADVAHDYSVPAATKLLVGDPADEIVAYADSLAADLIVIGSRGLGTVGRMILGSVSRAVLRETRRPVLVVREVEAPRMTTGFEISG